MRSGYSVLAEVKINDGSIWVHDRWEDPLYDVSHSSDFHRWIEIAISGEGRFCLEPAQLKDLLEQLQETVALMTDAGKQPPDWAPTSTEFRRSGVI